MTFWLLVGIYGGPLSYAIIPITIILMRNKGMNEELLIGYLFILILSDSLEEKLLFAKQAKNIYISMLALFFFIDQQKYAPFNMLYKIFVPFFLFSAFTMMFSVNDAFFFTSVQKTMSYFFTFLVIPNMITRLYREQGIIFFKKFLYFTFTTLIIGIILMYVAHDVAYIETGRYRGVMGNPNGLGIYALLIFIVFFIISDFYPDMFSRTQKTFFICTILLSIILTDSRNAIIGVMIFYIFQRFFSLSPFLGFILFLTTLVISEVISNNLASIILYLGLGDFFRINTLEEGSGRYVAWEFAWKQIQENFFIGKGFAYNEYYMRQHYGLLGKLGHQGGIHNSFLTFWMDQGLVGLLIYLRSYILMFIKASKKTKFAYPALFAMSFTAIFESWLVGSLSAFAFMAMFIYTIITSEEIVPETEEQEAGEMKHLTPQFNS